MTSNPIDDLCDAFEEQWQSGNVPSLEEWLDKVTAEQKSELLQHLLPIDVWWRRRQQQEVTVSGYLARFPEHEEQLLPFFKSKDTIAEDWNPFDRPAKRLAVGDYQLLQVLGRGGMGTVWLAQRAQPIKQRVALKLIRKDLNRHEVLKRFEIERQALSMMNHPNIARILDVGATEDGQPYFAMEYVQGTPITTYCDQNKLSIDDRLKLFQEVCLGVQHAHQKGIIHRDLKPSNILVGQLDGRPTPKIIDFGLAKALDGSQLFADQTLFTNIGQVLGTVRYMSPEQASMGATDVDTRSDIFSLGIILYELLTGTTPLDDSSIKEEAALRVLEMIREKDAIRPSKKLLSSTANESSTISQLRRTDSVRLTRVLQGELDWIVMKSLEKDRSRRYETAAAFAEDIYRYLNSQPIHARPPSWYYQTSKFVRRNRLAVFTSAFIMLALISAVVVADWGMRQAKRALKKQEEALKDAESVSGFFTELLSQAGPNAFGDKLTVVDAVEKRRQELIESEVLPPRRKVHFLSLLLDLYIQFGDLPKMRDIGQELKRIRDTEHALEDRDTLVIDSHLASVRWLSGDDEAAIKQLEAIIDPMREALGSDSADFLSTYQNLGLFYLNSEQTQQAERILGEIVERPGKLPTEGLLMAKFNLAILWTMTNRNQQGLDLLRMTLKEADEKLGPSHLTTLLICQSLGSSSGDREEVLRSLTRATAEYSRILGDVHDLTLNARQELFGALCNVGQWKDAIPHADILLKTYPQKLEEATAEEVKSRLRDARSRVMKSYLMALTEDRKYEVAVERLREWVDVELGSQSDREKFIYLWLLTKSYLQLGQLDLAEQEIQRIGRIEGLAEIEQLEKSIVELELRLRKSMVRATQEGVEDMAEREKRLIEMMEVVDVRASLDEFYQRAEKQDRLMKGILQSDVADIFSLYYTFVGKNDEADVWRKKNQRRSMN